MPWTIVNTLGKEQNGRHFEDSFILFLYQNCCNILIQIALPFVPKDPVHDQSAIAKTMFWCRTWYKPLSAPMMARLIDAYMRYLAWYRFYAIVGYYFIIM